MDEGPSSVADSNNDAENVDNATAKPPRRSARKSTPTRSGVKGETKKRDADSLKAEADETTPSPASAKKKKKTTKKKADTKKKGTAESSKTDTNEASSSAEETTKKKKKKPKKPPHQVLTERDELPKLWDADEAAKNGSYTFKIASWNVAGLRALLKKMPDVLKDLVKQHDLDVLCLQETKLQEQHLDDPKAPIRGLLDNSGYDEYYSCSAAKKGYSGTAVFVRRRAGGAKCKGGQTGASSSAKQTTLKSYFFATSSDPSEENEEKKDSETSTTPLPFPEETLAPVEVSYKIGKEQHDEEGRLVIVDFPLFTLCNVYVPNSGQQLQRLTYRTDDWDKEFLAFMQQKQKDRGVPVLWLGDLNVAHTNLEVWNDGAKHLPKQAGVTPEERASFQAQLDSGFVDAFRKLHPSAKGHYSYWSTRAGNREPNKGLRLDYYVCDPRFFDESSRIVARDSYMIYSQQGSDHCPVCLELEVKSKE